MKNGSGGTSVASLPFPASSREEEEDSSAASQSSQQYPYPKIAQDGPVDRYIQQLPEGDGLNNFFSLFLPGGPEYPLDPPGQNPLKYVATICHDMFVFIYLGLDYRTRIPTCKPN